MSRFLWLTVYTHNTGIFQSQYYAAHSHHFIWFSQTQTLLSRSLVRSLCNLSIRSPDLVRGWVQVLLD